MNITDTIKIKLWLKRFNFAELKAIKSFVDKEYNKRIKDTLVNKK